MAQLNIRNRNAGKLTKDGKPKPPNWEYRFEGAKIDGKRNQISKAGFRTKKDAEAAGIQRMAEYENAGLDFEPSEISFANYLDYWFDNYVKMECEYSTQVGYIQIIENHLKPALGIYKLKSLTPAMLQDYVNKKFANGGLKKNTLVGIMSVLSGSLRHAVLPYEFLKSSPAVYVNLPKVTGERAQSKRKTISLEDFNKIMERFPPTDRFGLAIMIGWYTGMRISEVHALTWDDIDLDKGIITVNKQVAKRNFGIDVRELYKIKGKKEEKSAWYFKDTKTTKSNRKLKIGETLIEALKDYKAIQDANIELYGEYYTKIYAKEELDEKGNKIYRLMEVEASVPVTLPELKLIMRRENGQFSSTDSFKYPSRIIHYDLGIPHFDFHSMRHSHATALVANKVPFKTIQDRLGHEKIETTLQTYTHVTEEMELEAVDVFEQFMKPL